VGVQRSRDLAGKFGLQHAPSVLEEAVWLLGAHAGLRLPGEALGLPRSAVDFQAGSSSAHGRQRTR